MLSVPELTELAGEIRQEIVAALSKSGGHLASNLGIVEITLALHRVFNSPHDTILWDVGHQCYVHKMLTGRRHQFKTLRQYKGLSGFVNPAESKHDAFVAGHSSTSISLAVGMAIARDHFGKDNKVIAVIGDGGLTGGMALEAINHLGHIQKNVLIVLNDNEMSISQNLGGFSQYMKRIKETYFYRDIKTKLDIIENNLDQAQLTPAIWNMIMSVKKQAKEHIETPGIVFEKLGVNYAGPVDGHDVAAVIDALTSAREKTTPQIVHIITRKGKGYAPAELDAIKYHGVSAFTPEPPLSEKIEPVQPVKPKAKTYSDVFSQALIEIGAIEPNMVAITPATAEGSGLVKFGEVYPERFFDVAICEQHAVTMAAGMAKAGLKPVVSIYSTFLQRAMDQVIHDVAILNLPVVFGIDRGGLVEDGETHQGVFDIAMLRAVPNFKIIAPKDATELQDMLYTVLQENNGPVAIRFPRDKALGADHSNVFKIVDYRRWEVLSSTEWHDVDSKVINIHAYPTMRTAPNAVALDRALNADIILLAYGSMVETARKALPALKNAGVSVTLINARCVKPLDLEMLSTLGARSKLKIVTLEEASLACGFGSAVLEWAARQKSTLQEIFCIGVGDHFVEHGAREILLDLNGLSVAKVTESVLKIWQGR